MKKFSILFYLQYWWKTPTIVQHTSVKNMIYLNNILCFFFVSITILSFGYNFYAIDKIELPKSTIKFYIIRIIQIPFWLVIIVGPAAGILLTPIVDNFIFLEYVKVFNHPQVYLLSLLYFIIQIKTYNLLKEDCNKPQLFFVFLILSAFLCTSFLYYEFRQFAIMIKHFFYWYTMKNIFLQVNNEKIG